jgi:hypothetical protein
MNSLENLKKIFTLSRRNFKTAADEHFYPSYNPNDYLNLDFNTLDHLDLSYLSSNRFNIISRTIETVEDYNLIINAETCDNTIHEKLTYIPLSFGYHTEDVNKYISSLDTILITAHNIVDKSKKDLGESPVQKEIEENIKNHLKTVELQKSFILKVINANEKLIQKTKFFAGNDSSFDQEEKEMFFKGIKKHLIANKEYISNGVNDKLNNFPSEIIESIVGIKNETYKLINTARELGINAIYKSMADQYKTLNNNGSPVAKFMTNKILEADTKTSLTFDKSNINSKVYLMNDSSILYTNKNGDMHTVQNNNELKKLLATISRDLIADIIPNKPKIIKFFNDVAIQEGLEIKTISHLLNTVNTFVNNQDVLKNIGLNILSIKEKSLENIDDYLNAESKAYKAKQFSKNILSNKYKSLETPESDIYFKELYEKALSEKDLQNYIGKKLASLKTPDDLIKLLKNVFQQLDGFTPENLERTINKFGIEPFYSKDNIIAFKIDKYEECKELGSPSWCIHREESYFNTYTNNDCRQFIIYDFEKDSKDVKSIIGFTTYQDGSLRTQHLKDDDYIEFNDKNSYLSEIHLKAVETYIPEKLMSVELRDIIYPEKPEEIELDVSQKKSTKIIVR